MRKFSFTTGGFYHLYNRGVDKRKIFLTTNDRKRFFKELAGFNCSGNYFDRSVASFDKPVVAQQPYVRIMAVCLMPNHYHILVEQLTEGGVSKLMQRLGTGYTSYFNTAHERTGRLFTGQFCAKPIESDEYLMHLSRYIHLNPLEIVWPHWKKQGLVDWETANQFLKAYPWSSYGDFVGGHTLKFVDPGILINFYRESTDYEKYMSEWTSASWRQVEPWLFESSKRGC